MENEAVKNDHPERVFVTGTGGNKDYLAIARKGNIILSVKPNYIGDGANLGVPGVTYFGVRIRSALAPKDMEPLFGKFEVNDKWGGIDWEKTDAKRASGQVGVFL